MRRPRAGPKAPTPQIRRSPLKTPMTRPRPNGRTHAATRRFYALPGEFARNTVYINSMKHYAIQLCQAGRLRPKHTWWATEKLGELFVMEERDQEHFRHTRVARLKGPDGSDLFEPLFDAVLLMAKPDWVTITGYQREKEAWTASTRAVSQTWVLIPEPTRVSESNTNRASTHK